MSTGKNSSLTGTPWKRIFLYGLAGISIFWMQMAWAIDNAHSSRIHAMERSPIIDGIINTAEWPEQYALKMSRAFHQEHTVRLYFAHDANYLYLGAYVEDADLWADGSGGGSGNIWDSAEDDSIEWYFDPDNSRNSVLMPNDRFLALNIGNFSAPISGNGIVSRRSFNQGDGVGHSIGVIGVNPSQLTSQTGIRYAVSYYGTVNNPSDRDIGYSMEVAVPWAALGYSSQPADGDSLGINAAVIFDDTGSTRDWSYNIHDAPIPSDFTPIRPDEYLELVQSPATGAQSGINGPVVYQKLWFHRNQDTTPPAQVGALTANALGAYSVVLGWSNPGDNDTHGSIARLDVRYSTSPISAANFAQASVWPLQSYPNTAGQMQTTRIMGLKPATAYYFAVRAYDEAGNAGAITTTGPVSTLTVEASRGNIPLDEYHGYVHVAPGGRYFMREDGSPFIPVGTHYLTQDAAIRYLYNAPVWNNATGQCYDFSTETNALTKVTDYLDTLRANKINTMRVWLEDFSLNVPNNGNFDATHCAYWLEFAKGQYNTKMAQFLVDLLRLSAERGIYVLINPFDTYYYDNYFDRTAWSAKNGGPLNNVDEFFTQAGALEMAKQRWTWVIETIRQSGYADAVLGYEILNEWDSWEWTRPVPSDANQDGAVRVQFMKELAAHIRSLDSKHMLLSSTASLDPRGALGDFIYYSEWFDALLPHLYLPSNREPWNNPQAYQDTAVVREQAPIVAWWMSIQLGRKPILDGEWGPSDTWLPDPAHPSYIPSFTEANDESLLRTLWFTELAAGAAGPGIRLQSGLRAFDKGLHLSDNMLATAQTLQNFVAGFDFSDFPAENWRGRASLQGAGADSVLLTAASDGRQGLVYLHQDKNQSTATVSSALLKIDRIKDGGGAGYTAEFWSTAPGVSAPGQVVASLPPDLATLGTARFAVPAFSDDWMIKFSEAYHARLGLTREGGHQLFSADCRGMQGMGPVDVYLVLRFNGRFYSLVRTPQGMVLDTSGAILPLVQNFTIPDGTYRLLALQVHEFQTIPMDVYFATTAPGSLNFKTLQKTEAFF